MDYVRPASGYATVAVAARNIESGAQVSEADVALVDVPEELIPADSFDSIDAVIHRRATTPITLHEVLSEPRFVGEKLASDLAGVPQAHVVAISPQDQGLIPILHTGAHVDVFTAGQEPNSVQLVAPGARVLLADPDNGVVLLALAPEHAGKVAVASLDTHLNLVLSTMVGAV